MKICILGRHGLIGRATARKFEAIGYEITSNPTKDVEAIIHLASPTHLEFEENVPYHMGESIRSFELLLPFSKEHDIHFIYASSALVYEDDKKTPMKNCKIILEQMAEAYGGRTLGLRIFPVYGRLENRTALSQWCKQMRLGLRPIVFGKGTQKRDFIYVEDVADAIVNFLLEGKTGIADVGSGKPVSFNQIVEEINKLLKTNIKPEYIPSPPGYSKGIVCKNPVKTRYDIKKGIKELLW